MQKGNAEGKSYNKKKKKDRRSKKKESNLFFAFSKLLPWATSLNLPSLE